MDLVFAGARKGAGTFSAKEVEVRAALSALNALHTSDQFLVILCIDALEVINAIMGQSDWHTDLIINDIQARGRCIESFEVVCVPRKLNKVAHGPAKWG